MARGNVVDYPGGILPELQDVPVFQYEDIFLRDTHDSASLACRLRWRIRRGWA